MEIQKHKLGFSSTLLPSIQINDGWTVSPLIFNNKKYVLDFSKSKNPLTDKSYAIFTLFRYDKDKKNHLGEQVFKTNCDYIMLDDDEPLSLNNISETLFTQYIKEISMYIFKLYMEKLKEQADQKAAKDNAVVWDGVIK